MTATATDWVRDAIREGYEESKRETTAHQALVEELVDAFVQNLRVLRQRDGAGPSDDQARERGKNYVQFLVLAFELKRRPQ